MDVTISDRQLKKVANNDRKLTQKFGPKRAQLIKLRLDDLRDLDNLEQARHLPGNYHELVGNRKGQWACNLDHPHRLILVPHENPIPTDPDGKYIWIEILGVDITEIIDYHGK
jgi:proteic killer suppression protein